MCVVCKIPCGSLCASLHACVFLGLCEGDFYINEKMYGAMCMLEKHFVSVTFFQNAHQVKGS